MPWFRVTMTSSPPPVKPTLERIRPFPGGEIRSAYIEADSGYEAVEKVKESGELAPMFYNTPDCKVEYEAVDSEDRFRDILEAFRNLVRREDERILNNHKNKKHLQLLKTIQK